MPSEPSSSTTIDVVAAAAICVAASRIVVAGEHSSGGSRISAATGWFTGSGAGLFGAIDAGRRACSSNSERATKPTLSGRASTERATSAGMR
jgi:hypothetical protein